MERDGLVAVTTDGRDRRSKIVTMTDKGRHVWQILARPKILSYYEDVLTDFSINDIAHTLHYLLKIIENMQRVDVQQLNGEDDGGGEAESLPA